MKWHLAAGTYILVCQIDVTNRQYKSSSQDCTTFPTLYLHTMYPHTHSTHAHKAWGYQPIFLLITDRNANILRLTTQITNNPI